MSTLLEKRDKLFRQYTHFGSFFTSMQFFIGFWRAEKARLFHFQSVEFFANSSVLQELWTDLLPKSNIVLFFLIKQAVFA